MNALYETLGGDFVGDHFRNHYANFNFSLDKGAASPGFRNAQIGALHALASHFTVRDEAALIVMPTGTGKTAVIMGLPYVLGAKRVLVLASSRVIRSQIAQDFASLRTLKHLRALGPDIASPKVKEQSAIVSDWNELKEYDVVVSLPGAIARHMANAPKDLFDLVVVDEAHHSPAKTWRVVMKHFGNSRQALFTATPFRNDSRQIPGRMVFRYSLTRARSEGLFAPIRFVPVTVGEDQTQPLDSMADKAIAQSAERVLMTDRDRGLTHKLLIRTNSIKRAKELLSLYGETTKLKLDTICGRESYKTVQAKIKWLRDGTLDGIICVNMLGEGFDLPELKVAAIHAPHKSLSITLQFIGRLSRTGSENLGEAKFVAIPSAIEVESERLYDEDADWEKIVLNLYETRINEEEQAKEFADTFKKVGNCTGEDDFTLHSLRPSAHVKVYKTETCFLGVDLSRSKYPTVYSAYSEEHHCRVVIIRRSSTPEWLSNPVVQNINYELIAIYHDAKTQLLFLGSSIRTERFYEDILGSVAPNAVPLDQTTLFRALAGAKELVFFSVGLRNGNAMFRHESYRTIVGPQAHLAVTQTDAANFYRGHLFGKGRFKNQIGTIGLSTSSKIWSNAAFTIPRFVAWCREIGERMTGDLPPSTGSEIDRIPMGRNILSIPKGVIGVDWHHTVYSECPQVSNGKDAFMLLDGDLSCEQKDDGSLVLHYSCSDSSIDVSFTVTNGLVEYKELQNPRNWRVRGDEGEISLSVFLKEHPPTFFLDTMDCLVDNREIQQCLRNPLNPKILIARNWEAIKTNIRKETKEQKAQGNSIHEAVECFIPPDVGYIIRDHRSGEVADYISIEQVGDHLDFILYHCKASSKAKPGVRMVDLYEVCGQALKSVHWARNGICNRLIERVNQGSAVLRGSSEELCSLLTKHRDSRNVFGCVIVQPGLSRGAISTKKNLEGLGYKLAAVHDSFINQGWDSLSLWVSS
jgi:superfamily II DNA or RNA helicase